jgi:hypothetical protein
MLNVGGARQSFRQSVGKHKVSSKGHKAKNTTKDEFSYKIAPDINMA